MESMPGLATVTHVRAVRRLVQVFIASVLAAYVVAPHSALATTVTLPASQDSWVEQANRSTNHGGDSALWVEGGSGQSQPKKHALVQFDLSSIPACATVTGATLTLYRESSTGTTGTPTDDVIRVTESWTETGVLPATGVTWLTRDETTNWTQPGGTIADTVTASVAIGSAAGPVTWDVTTDVGAFVVGTANYGWLIKVAPEGTAVTSTYSSREGTTPPSLEVTYTLEDANCNDSNECTEDTCTPSGCQNQAQVGQLCGDSTTDTCTHPDTCDANGICQPNDEPDGTQCGVTPPECKKWNTCRAGSCTDNGFEDPGTPCGDHSQTACTDPDTCNGAGACLANNQADGTTCNDGDTCTATDTCQSGICNGQDVICGPSAVCSPQPKTGCRNPTESNKASVLIKNTTPDTADRLIWRWIKGAQTVAASFGNPVTDGGTGYRLCIYDENGGNAAEVKGISVPPGGLCGSQQKPCWKRLGRQTAPTGYVYTDPNAAGDGVFKLLLHEGTAGKARILFGAKGPKLGPPALPLHQNGAVIVQLNRTDEPTECWEAQYSGPAKNPDVGKGIKFFDKGD